MILFYGLKTNRYHSIRHDKVKCLNCGVTGMVNFNRYAKVFHLFYIPLFPIKLKTQAECTNCKESFMFGEMDKVSRSKYKKHISFKGPPFWYFSGLIVTIALLIWSSIQNGIENNELRSKLDSLETGRLIEFKSSQNQYSIYKVCSVDGNEIRVLENQYQVSSKEELSRIRASRNFNIDTIPISKETLNHWNDEDKIVAIYWGSVD